MREETQAPSGGSCTVWSNDRGRTTVVE